MMEDSAELLGPNRIRLPVRANPVSHFNLDNTTLFHLVSPFALQKQTDHIVHRNLMLQILGPVIC